MVSTTGILDFIVVVPMAIGAASDVATRKIPDCISAFVAVIGLAARILTAPEALAGSVAACVLLFAVLALLHGRGLLGGGDVKLMSAIAIGLSLTDIARFLCITVMAGGALALLHLVARWALCGQPPVAPPRRGASLIARVLSAERWRIARHGSLPYGVAIACGGIWAIIFPSGS